jgi:hypothetical protein
MALPGADRMSSSYLRGWSWGDGPGKVEGPGLKPHASTQGRSRSFPFALLRARMTPILGSDGCTEGDILTGKSFYIFQIVKKTLYSVQPIT